MGAKTFDFGMPHKYCRTNVLEKEQSARSRCITRFKAENKYPNEIPKPLTELLESATTFSKPYTQIEGNVGEQQGIFGRGL